MTREEAIKMMKAKLECMTREISGTDYDCNNRSCDDCRFNYAQGNMGEQKEWMKMAIKALEQESASPARTEWIPVSERLPSEEERKEWIDEHLDGLGYLYPCLVTRYSAINPERTANNPYVAKHYFDGVDFVKNGEEVCSEFITAWMPLPEPYKVESEVEDGSN